MLLLYANYSVLNFCMSEDARNSDVISEAYLKVCLDKRHFLPVLKDHLKDGEFSGEELLKDMLASLLLLVLSDRPLLFYPSTWLPEADFCQNAVICKDNCPGGRTQMSLLNTRGPVLSCTVVVCRCYVLDLLVKSFACCHLKLLNFCPSQ